jgi:glucose/arabinose dehydrogenase
MSNLPRPLHAFVRCAFLATLAAGPAVTAAAPTLIDPGLQVSTAASGLVTPVGMAFIGANDMFVLEKNSGRVQRVVNGVVQSTVLDLAVNSGSERGLLGIALDPSFATNGRVYLYNTESTTGADTNVVTNVPLLGNRVDRFVWNGSTLTFDQNLVRLRAYQADAGQSPLGNHNGGVMRFGADGKLYVAVGDVGRRGWLQNLPNGPSGGADDAFGGPAPDNAHFTGGILRLNTDGTAPADNPFFAAGAALGGEAGANVQKLYAYGIRNTFGMAFDPVSGKLWAQDNGDDAFDELNRVDAGMNGGWVQTMGPISRVAEYKAIETTAPYAGLQQIRWNPTNIADTPAGALSATFMLPGASYSDPEFSWKYAVAPGGIGFLTGAGLGAQYAGNLFVGAARTTLEGGYLFRFGMSGDRMNFDLGNPALQDLVADNLDKFGLTESESLLFGRGFGVVTEIQTGPNGNLFLVSLTDGAIYEIKAVNVPEPATWMLLALCFAALGAARTRGLLAPLRDRRRPS